MMTQLCVCVCVAELGDYDAVAHGTSSDYIARCKLLPKQADGQHDTIADLHRTLS